MKKISRLLFRNYDYGGPEEPSATSPGRGLFNGPMSRYKSVEDFLKRKRKRRSKLKNSSMYYNSDFLLKAAEQFLLATAEVPQTSTVDLSEAMKDIAAKFDPEAQMVIQNLANAGKISEGTHADINIDFQYVPVKKGSSYVAKCVAKVTGSPDSIRNAIQQLANKYTGIVTAKVTSLVGPIWSGEEAAQKSNPAAHGPTGGSFNFRQLNFQL